MSDQGRPFLAAAIGLLLGAVAYAGGIGVPLAVLIAAAAMLAVTALS